MIFNSFLIVYLDIYTNLKYYNLTVAKKKNKIYSNIVNVSLRIKQKENCDHQVLNQEPTDSKHGIFPSEAKKYYMFFKPRTY